jgi:putative ABC transport system permease protein
MDDSKGREHPLVTRWTLAFVRWFCPQGLQEGIEGDLLEALEADIHSHGGSVAQRRLIWNAFRFFRLSIILRNRVKTQNNTLTMFRNYFKITIRNISRSKGYSFINIFGLSLGIACCLLTANYVVFEFSFDNFHPNVDRTYRIDQTLIWDPDGGTFGSTGLPLASLMARDYPEVEEATRINTPGDFVIRRTDESGHALSFNEDYIFAVDSNFFNFFGFPLKEGDPRTALTGINKVVISSEIAQKFFGNEPALGKILLLGDEKKPIEVSGVAEPLPANTHLKFKYLLSMHTNPAIKKFEWSWIWTQVVTYVRLRPGADPVALENKMTRIGDLTIKPSFQRLGINYDDFMQGKGAWEFFLMPVQDIHLKSRDNRLGSVGDIRYPYAFGVIGFFVLTIACINFVNLSTARGTKRAREVGVKKALGALRSSLIVQFQAESIFLATISLILSIPLLEGLRLLFVFILNDDMPFTLWNNPTFLIALPALAIIIGIIAGLYPSFYLTSFEAVQVLKGKLSTKSGNAPLRNSLVVIQFAISITLLIGTVLVFQQMKFIRAANLGFDKTNTLVINYAERLGEHIEGFRNEVGTLPGISSASIAMDVPRGRTYEDIYSAEGTTIKLPVGAVKIDDHYFNAMGFQLVSGRVFDVEHNAVDKHAFMMNETAAKLFGWTPEEALGKVIIAPGDDRVNHQVIGVVKDFHFESMRSKINPVFFDHIQSDTWGDMRVVAIKYKTNDLPELIRSVERKWNAAVEQTTMDFSFLEDDIAREYGEDRRLGDIFGIFSALSIIIALIGLIGLVAYSTEVRKKEIGIRKVLGASSSTIVVMMNSHYVKLIALGILISMPMAWYAMNYWLETFEFKIPINPLVFILSGLAVMMASLLSVAYLSLRAASVNPASVLKEE